MRLEMTNPDKSWNSGFDCMKGLAKTLSELHGDNVRVLKIIKKELAVKCKHPKKMRDKTPDGKLYCMNCNLDL